MATKVSVGKLVPSAVVLSVAGWCTWTTLSGSDTGADGPPTRLPEITHAQLSPTILPAPPRDPFKNPGEVQPNVLARLKFKERSAEHPGLNVNAGGDGLTFVENE